MTKCLKRIKLRQLVIGRGKAVLEPDYVVLMQHIIGQSEDSKFWFDTVVIKAYNKTALPLRVF